ncbi:MAG: PAS domain-containing protein [Solirubrobacterales bacterium]|nr:PAS domain-containing protein [Solirubrobacterales bacterium]
MTDVQHRLQRLFELSLDVLFVLDRQGCVVLVSPSIERVLGYSPEEIQGRRIIELVHPDEEQRTRELSAALLERGALDGFENRYRHADGSDDGFLDVIHPDDRARVAAAMAEAVRTGGEAAADYRLPGPDERILHGRVEAELGPDGRTRIMRGTVQDVTEARREERRRRESEERLSEAERLVGMGSWEYDIKRDDVLWSENLYALWGAEPGSMPALRRDAFYARLQPEERERVTRAAQEGLARDARFEVSFEQPTETGHDRVLVVRGEYFERDGRPMLRGTVLDVTAQRRATALQALIGRLGRRALESDDVGRVLDQACAMVAQALGAGFAIILAAHEDGSLRLAAGTGPSEARDTLIVEPGAASPALHALALGEPVVVSDWRDEDRFGYTGLMESQGVRSSVVVPIGGRHRSFGVLSVNAPVPWSIDDDDLAFLEAAASILAAAIDRRRAEEAVAALADVRGRLVAETLDAEERIRRSISEQLHDGALQDLLAARQDLVEAAGDEPGRTAMIGYAREGVERAVARLREAVQALHPIVLQHGGLEVALQAAAEQTGRTGGFTARVEVDPEAAGVRDELVLSMARELLTNAAKHAGATTVDVAVRRYDRALVLEVADDGRGADLAAVAAAPLEGHIGLASIAQRAEAVGGTFEVESPPRGGTVARAVLPVGR